MKVFKYLLIGLVVVIFCLAVYFQIFFRQPLPDYDGTIVLEGLEGEVTVHYDDYGVPHIFAENEHDLFFAQGYLTARERMFQMDMTRMAGRGELSLLFGEATLETDKFLKAHGFYRTARLVVEEMPEEYRGLIQAYVDGVNAYIDTVETLPREYAILGVEPEPWVPEDCAVAGILMAYSLTRSKKTDLILHRIGEIAGEEVLESIIPEYPDYGPRVSGPAAESGDTATTLFTDTGEIVGVTGIPKFLDHFELPASNWMLFGPSKTTTGAALLAGSPDLEPKIPSLFYLVHLKGGRFDVIGGSVPGAPGVNVVGYNGHIAWSTVNGRVDELDYFIEKVNPDNENQYLTEDGYVDFEIVTEILKIKTKDGVREEEYQVKISRHGPIISDVMSLAPENTAVMWVGNEPMQIFPGFADMCLAENFDQFRAAIGRVTTPTLNFGYADSEGNIGYQYMASPPIRKKGDGTLPVPGWTGEYDWIGHVPFEDLPNDLNPEKGYFASFNNEPYPTPYHVTDFYLFERALSFEALIADYDVVSPEDAREFQLNTVSMVARRWTPVILEATEDIEDCAEARELLVGWDHAIDIDSPAATIVNEFYVELMKNTLADEAGEDVWDEYLSQYIIIYIPDLVLTNIIDDVNNPLFDDVTTEDVVETRDDIVRRSFLSAVDSLTDRLGNNMEKWAWGEVHEMTFTHPMGEKLPFFNLKPVPIGGDDFTINAGLWDNTHPYAMKSGGVIRLIVDFSTPETNTIISPPGQSGQFMSPHYNDLVQSWVSNAQIPMHFLDAEELPTVLILTGE